MSQLLLPFKGAVKDRMSVIAPLVEGRKTLDLGVVDSRRRRDSTDVRLAKKSATSLHTAIHKLNDQVVGVDIDRQGVEILLKANFKVRVADVVTMNLGEKFETIVAGDIIEHLSNNGQFLENMARHLNDDGTLIITTPNPFHIKQVWKIWRYNRPQVHEDHTCWFCPLTLSNLCDRSGLRVTSIYWIQKPGQWLRTGPKYLRSYFSNSFMLLATHK